VLPHGVDEAVTGRFDGFLRCDMPGWSNTNRRKCSSPKRARFVMASNILWLTTIIMSVNVQDLAENPLRRDCPLVRAAGNGAHSKRAALTGNFNVRDQRGAL
jgi:hypothetical protein